MKISFLLSLCAPLAVTYFARIGESSIYSFDFYFILIMLFSIIKDINILKYMGPICCFIFISLLGFTIFASNGNGEIENFLPPAFRYIQIFIIFGFFSSALNNIKTPPIFTEVEKNFEIIILSASIPLYYGMFFYFINPEMVLKYNRLSSYFNNPNAISSYCSIILPILAFYIFKVTNSIHKKVFFAILYFIPAIFTLVFAGSNGGWILLITTTSILSIIYFKSIGIKVIPYISIFVTSFIVLYTMQISNSNLNLTGFKNTQTFIETALSFGEVSELGSGELRGELARNATKTLLENPLHLFVGFGLGQSDKILSEKYGTHNSPHNSYLNLIAESGIIGFSFLIYGFFRVIRFYSSNLETFSIFLGYLLAMNSTPHLYLPYTWALVAASAYYAQIITKAYNTNNSFLRKYNKTFLRKKVFKTDQFHN